MILTLQRDIDQPDASNCTLGVLTVGDSTFQTMERPWIPNPNGPGGHPQTSCIPIGDYTLTPRYSPAKGHHWLLSNPYLGIYASPADIPEGQPWGRSLVLIHSANWAYQLLGCIAPGQSRTRDTQGQWMVTNSVASMISLRKLLTDAELILTIS